MWGTLRVRPQPPRQQAPGAKAMLGFQGIGSGQEAGPVRQTRVNTALEWLDRAIGMGMGSMAGQGRAGLLQRWRPASSSIDVGSVSI